MIYVGVDVAKNKHDCCILNSEDEKNCTEFQISNTLEGFRSLEKEMRKLTQKGNEIKVGLESTGHYSTNILEYLTENQYQVTSLNPLAANLFRKSMTLRKTKTDKTDAKVLATMLMQGENKPYISESYQIKQLKSLTRHRFRFMKYRSKCKVSYTRLITIGFPELTQIVSTIHSKSVYEMFIEYPDIEAISKCRKSKLSKILSKMHGKNLAEKIREAAKKSIGTKNAAVGIELRHVIKLIEFIGEEISEIEKETKKIIDGINSPIMTIPGISYILGGMLIAEIGDIERFDSAAKLLAFAGLEPSTYQSGKYKASVTPMVKRGSKYLRWAVLESAAQITRYDKTFFDYYQKKRSEGKHHYVALSHTGKKLIRVMYSLLKNNQVFISQS